ncbi:MAG: hypothetical protein P8163_09100, partial [Candidatus Thiodiazotropha sp.]
INTLPWQTGTLFYQQLFEQATISLVQLAFGGLAYAALHKLLSNREHNADKPPTASRKAVGSLSTHQMT